MIVLVLSILTAAGPVAHLRSVESFASLEACHAALLEEQSEISRLQREIAAQLSQPVRIDARCVDLAPGVPA